MNFDKYYSVLSYRAHSKICCTSYKENRGRQHLFDHLFQVMDSESFLSILSWWNEKLVPVLIFRSQLHLLHLGEHQTGYWNMHLELRIRNE
jgi:hypothetical protein